ncbi:MAG: hypothetical protein ABWZ42_12010 [Ilumatobacteraceae bacterium]
MNRRAARALVPILTLIVLLGGAGGAVAAPEPTVPPTTAPAAPVVTANEFLPTDRDLTDCVGVLEKPGCGSEERGGTATTVVFVVMLLAMVLIFGRIVVGVRQNRRAIDP